MKIINEDQIENCAEVIGNLEAYETLLTSLSETQPALVRYLYSESFQSFTVEEQQLFLFMALVIWKTIDEKHDDIDELSEEEIAEAEERNWDILQAAGKGDFRERLTPFFEDSPQEDLLAFVEDSVVPDEDNMVTEEGKEYLFISMKTIIDAFAGVLEEE